MTENSLLIVHEDEDVVLLLKALVKNQCSSIEMATNFEQVQDQIAAQIFQTILTDINIDGVSQNQYIKYLRNTSEDVRIIVISDMDQKEIIKDLLALGVSAFLNFPVNPQKLLDTLSNTTIE